VLHPIRTYHFDDACAYFTNDVDSYSLTNCLKNLPIIFYETTYDLSMMDGQDFIDHVTKLHVAHKERRIRIEEERVSTQAAKEQAVIAQVRLLPRLWTTILLMRSLLISLTLMLWMKPHRCPK